MSIFAKSVSRGVHNIAFSLLPDPFRALEALESYLKGRT
jgi:hypothetical protein